LIPFGGAGPLHGVALAEAVAAKDIIVPVAPGITAAMGLLETDMLYEHARSLITSLTRIEQDTIGTINALLDDLVGLCRQDLENDGVPKERQNFQRFAECRYHGQGFELRAAIPDGEVTPANVGAITTAFHEQHRLDYGYAFDDGEIELITIRVIGTEDVTPLKVAKLERANGAGIDQTLLYTRSTTFDNGRTLETPRYDRDGLKAGHEVPGPAVIIQHNSTTLVPPGYGAAITDYGNLHIQRTNNGSG
ncbi:MAG: hydantoinase/oxoprolinase family protein, partial [Geminicoccaceae bacterium]